LGKPCAGAGRSTRLGLGTKDGMLGFGGGLLEGGPVPAGWATARVDRRARTRGARGRGYMVTGMMRGGMMVLEGTFECKGRGPCQS